MCGIVGYTGFQEVAPILLEGLKKLEYRGCDSAEIAVATTKGYTTQLSVLYLFALYAAKKLNRIDKASYMNLLTSLKVLPKKVQAATVE